MASDPDEGIRQFRQHQPHFVVTELNFAGPTGAAMIARFQDENPAAKVVILTSVKNQQILHAGAATSPRGFIHKSDSIQILSQSIEMALRGGISTSPTITKILQSSAPATLRNFTNPELLIISLIADGEPTKAIARIVGRSEKAVESLRAKIMIRADVRSPISLVRYAIREA